MIDHATSIREAEEATRQIAYDLNLLDRRLPDGDGAELIPRIRAMRPGARVMMLTALNSLTSKVSGLEAGADDYLTKPFQGEELIARVRACLRRPGSGFAAADPRRRALLRSGDARRRHRRQAFLLASARAHAARGADPPRRPRRDARGAAQRNLQHAATRCRRMRSTRSSRGCVSGSPRPTPMWRS